MCVRSLIFHDSLHTRAKETNLKLGLCGVLSKGAHDGAKLLGCDGAIAILVKEGEGLLELGNLLLGQLIRHFCRDAGKVGEAESESVKRERQRLDGLIDIADLDNNKQHALSTTAYTMGFLHALTRPFLFTHPHMHTHTRTLPPPPPSLSLSLFYTHPATPEVLEGREGVVGDEAKGKAEKRA